MNPVTSSVHVTSGAYLHWSCARCHGWHRYRISEMEINTRALAEEYISTDGILAMGPSGFEVTVQISDPTDLNCVGRIGGPNRDSVWDAEVQRKIRAAISYTVLDPDERAALMTALVRELRAD